MHDAIIGLIFFLCHLYLLFAAFILFAASVWLSMNAPFKIFRWIFGACALGILVLYACIAAQAVHEGII